MKYLHKPKTKSVVFFLTLIIIGVALNLPFLLMQKSIIAYNLDALLILHLFLPVIYGLIMCALFSYLLFTLEAIISNLKDNKQMKIYTFLRVLEICAGILIFLVVAYQFKGQDAEKISFLRETLYFKSLITAEDLTSVLLYWVYIYRFSLFAFSFILFFAVERQSKIKKRLIQNVHENQVKSEINQFLGFDYESCDFFQQVNISYKSLQQTDGTRGEFEVYHMLRKSGLAGAKYVFNREVPKADGLNTELDLIVIHKNGIFVVENKHYTTRIYGSALDHALTIIDHSGNRKSVYNPIKQNENHVVALKEFLKSKDLYIDDKTTPIYSIVVFTAEGYDRTDNIISGISTIGTETKVCTSQNVYLVINQLIINPPSTAEINVSKTNELLLSLPIRRKYS